jgi:hypothetical protein
MGNLHPAHRQRPVHRRCLVRRLHPQGRPDAKLSAGAFKVTANGISATTRGRIVADYGYTADFEDIELSMKNEFDPTEAVNFPPLPWLGARLKWHVLEKDGSKVLGNRLDNVLFQRTMNFFGAHRTCPTTSSKAT